MIFVIIMGPVLFYLPGRLSKLELPATVWPFNRVYPEGFPDFRGSLKEDWQPRTLQVCGAILLLPVLSLVLNYTLQASQGEADWLSPGKPYAVVAGRVEWQPKFESADEQQLAQYALTEPNTLNSDTPVVLFQAYYAYQQEGTEVVDSLNRLANPEWRIEARRQAAIQLGEGRRASSLIASSQSEFAGVEPEYMLVWYWYKIGQRHASTALGVKFSQVIEKLLLRPQGSVFAISTACQSRDCQLAAERLKEFVGALQDSESN